MIKNISNICDESSCLAIVPDPLGSVIIWSYVFGSKIVNFGCGSGFGYGFSPFFSKLTNIFLKCIEK